MGLQAHFAWIVRDWLNDHFPQRWLGRAGPIEWPARSPDLTPCDFFLVGIHQGESVRHKTKNCRGT